MGSNGVLRIPIVDLSAFTNNDDPESCQAAAKALAEKVHINGSVGISGHGLASKVLEEAFAVTKKLFDLLYEDKMKAPHPDAMVPNRGYSDIGREKGAAKTALETDDEAKKDNRLLGRVNPYLQLTRLKESYEIGSEQNSVQYNIWLPEDVLPNFRQFTTKFFWELHKTASMILEALIMGLDLTEEEAATIRALHTGHDNQLRLLHYPSISAEMLKNETVGRLQAHTDWSNLTVNSLFTLLFQDSNSGLEFGDRETGDFASAMPKEGVLYMNIGDMLDRVYPSGLHRVVVSGKANGEETPARYSIPYFVTPTPDDVIAPSPSLVARQAKQIYEVVTFNSYSEQMFQRTNVFE
ncbi:hypothetical protein HYALB_00001950 [Hymenoscyphus albidus]|uniref:Fe2OG dioxygenase domain-containing protein n=1 Tax=Hymenoscyphus albidus TaxID=595503 RepID=A0A9N9LAV4_9HELO|nr:hypothetical protein HYALB_00001950 [Hymenoscyphus albidus]